MLRYLALFVGLFSLWLVATQRWSAPGDLIAAAIAGGVATLVAARLGGATAAFASAPRALYAAARRAAAVVRGALMTARAAAAADIALQPALVRIRVRSRSEDARAAFADLVSATPGLVVVETEPDALMAHALMERDADATALAQLERLAAPTP